MDPNIRTALIIAALFVLVYGRSFLGSRKKRELTELLVNDDNVLVVDVRTSGEYREGHVDSAINIPVENIKKAGKKLGAKDRPIVLYCASGARSRVALTNLRSMGYTRVYNGGTLAAVQRMVSG